MCQLTIPKGQQLQQQNMMVHVKYILSIFEEINNNGDTQGLTFNLQGTNNIEK